MTSAQTHWPINRALVAKIRSLAVYSTVKGVYEGAAPEEVDYPFIVYNLAVGAYEYLFGNDTTLIAMVDISAFSRSSVDAENIDMALAAGLSDQPLAVTGQTTLLCRRVATMPTPPDLDNEGKKVYQKGGTYHIETDAPPLP